MLGHFPSIRSPFTARGTGGLSHCTHHTMSMLKWCVCVCSIIGYTTPFTKRSRSVAVDCYIKQADGHRGIRLLFHWTLESVKITDRNDFERGTIVCVSATPDPRSRFTKNDATKRKHPVGGSPVGESNSLMREVEGEWKESCKITGRGHKDEWGRSTTVLCWLASRGNAQTRRSLS